MVPTLEQILWTAKGNIEVDVELKESGYEDEVISMVLDYFEYMYERGVKTDFIFKTFKMGLGEWWKPRRKELLEANFLTE